MNGLFVILDLKSFRKLVPIWPTVISLFTDRRDVDDDVFWVLVAFG
jgi:hypothetical protein